MDLTIIAHGVELDESNLSDCRIVATTTSPSDLSHALTAAQPSAVVMDIDDPSAVRTIISSLEVCPHLAIVGITDGSNLNRVIEAQRVGCRQITTRPVDPNDLVIALRRAISTGQDDVAHSCTVAMFGTIGGAGSTTIGAHLAIELAEQARCEAAVIDLDLEFGGVARSFDINPQFTLADLASAGTVDAVLLDKATVKLDCGVSVIARPGSIHEGQSVDENSVRNILQAVRRKYSQVVIDLPRRLDPISGVALEQADRVLLVLQCTVPSVDNARRLLSALDSERFPLDRVGLVVNRFRKGTQSFTPETIQKELGQQVLAVIPSDFAAVNHSLDTGKHLAERNPVRSAIARLALTLIGGGDVAAKRSGGWFKKLGLGA